MRPSTRSLHNLIHRGIHRGLGTRDGPMMTSGRRRFQTMCHQLFPGTSRRVQAIYICKTHGERHGRTASVQTGCGVHKPAMESQLFHFPRPAGPSSAHGFDKHPSPPAEEVTTSLQGSGVTGKVHPQPPLPRPRLNFDCCRYPWYCIRMRSMFVVISPSTAPACLTPSGIREQRLLCQSCMAAKSSAFIGFSLARRPRTP